MVKAHFFLRTRIAPFKNKSLFFEQKLRLHCRIVISGNILQPFLVLRHSCHLFQVKVYFSDTRNTKKFPCHFYTESFSLSTASRRVIVLWLF